MCNDDSTRKSQVGDNRVHEIEKSSLRWWMPAAREGQLSYEAALNDVPTTVSLRGYHDLLASEPHIAGTPGDLRNIDRMVAAFELMGLEVKRHDIWVYLPEPIDAAVEIKSPVNESLPLRERVLAEDSDTAHEDLTFGFNAFSATGDVTGEVVYANYGRKEDFEKLRELGVDVAGKIVIARFGENYRGYKAVFAEEAGAAGLIIYIDPQDGGYGQGVPYPEGGCADETSIQRGSLLTLPYPGDPLTPFAEATEHADRLDPADVALPCIPVQPIGWGAAERIMSRMTGRALPQKLVESWQGGLPFAYRIEGGENLRVRVMVEQEHKIKKTANVIATLPGEFHPEQKVIIGGHHDAWGHGAGDPLSGLIAVFESARAFAELARAGQRPARTLIFAAWGAEEAGIMGSTEWCEAAKNRDDLLQNAVAYINLDMASMGPDFSSAAAPMLKQLIADAACGVAQARGEPGQTVFDLWTDNGAKEPKFDNLGGGSDHVAFYCHLGVPSCALVATGGHGVSYHTNYDTLRWYRQVVGEDYEPALMITLMTNLVAGRLARAEILPLDPVRCAADVRGHLKDLVKRADELGDEVDFDRLEEQITDYEHAMRTTWGRLMVAAEDARLGSNQIEDVNQLLLPLQRLWLEPAGLPGRPWFRNLFAATDPDSGYSAWMLPELRAAIERRDVAAVDIAAKRLSGVYRKLSKVERDLAGILDSCPGNWNEPLVTKPCPPTSDRPTRTTTGRRGSVEPR